jgi:predicted ATP-grasp superfamily ATP-dependent carboligase
MLRIWVNRAFATTARALRMLRDNPDRTEVMVIGSHVDEASPVLAECDLAVAEPDVVGATYLQWALQFAREHRVDVFLPRMNQDVIAANLDRFQDIGVAVLCPPASAVTAFADKASTYRQVAELGLGVAPWRLACGPQELATALDDLRDEVGDAPVCVKPAQSIGGRGFRIVLDRPPALESLLGQPEPLITRADLLAAFDAAAQAGGPIPDMIVQPVLAEPEVSIDTLATPGGRLLAAVARTKTPRVRMLLDDPPSVEYARQIVENFGLSYLCNVQLRRWRGERVLLEVNTRPSAGLYQTALAGVNLLWAAVQLALTGTAPPLPVRCGARYTVLEDVVLLPGRED